jgi:hypothetical protein
MAACLGFMLTKPREAEYEDIKHTQKIFSHVNISLHIRKIVNVAYITVFLGFLN